MSYVIGNSTIILLIAGFVIEKNKRYSYDTGYKLKEISYAEEHGNKATERDFGPPPPEKTISKEQLKKIMKTKCANKD